MPDEKEGGLDYLKAAFHWRANKIGLAAAVCLAGLTASIAPLILVAGLEMMYLAIVPNNPRFQRLVRSWKFDEQERERAKSLSAMYYELPPEMRGRFSALDQVCRVIRDNYKRLTSTSQMFVDQMDSKLDGLSQSYLRLLNSAFHHREYLRTASVDTIRREAAQLQKDIPNDPPKVQEINRKRIEILNKRVEKHEKIKENCAVVDAQCAAIEDVLQLIRDQSVTMHDPQTISDHLDSLVKDVEQTEETVREVESIFDISPLASAELDSGSVSRTRVRN